MSKCKNEENLKKPSTRAGEGRAGKNAGHLGAGAGCVEAGKAGGPQHGPEMTFEPLPSL